MTRLAVAGLFASIFGFATRLAQRELSWDALDVSARLDADGVLHVTEQQTIVFDGDWNGGERAFNLRPRQTFEFAGMERLDLQLGTRVPLVEDRRLDDIDEYALIDGRTLRWRRTRAFCRTRSSRNHSSSASAHSSWLVSARRPGFSSASGSIGVSRRCGGHW